MKKNSPPTPQKQNDTLSVLSNNRIQQPAVTEIQNVKMQKMVRNYLNNYVDFNYLN